MWVRCEHVTACMCKSQDDCCCGFASSICESWGLYVGQPSSDGRSLYHWVVSLEECPYWSPQRLESSAFPSKCIKGFPLQKNLKYCYFFFRFLILFLFSVYECFTCMGVFVPHVYTVLEEARRAAIPTAVRRDLCSFNLHFSGGWSGWIILVHIFIGHLGFVPVIFWELFAHFLGPLVDLES